MQHSKTLIFVAILVAGLSGCVNHRVIRMMPRDSGKVSVGTVDRNSGNPTISIVIDGELFTGPIVRTSSSETVGLISQYGRGGPSFGTAVTTGGGATIKGILSSPSGRGLRCELTSDGNNKGGGIAVDDKGRIYDVVITAK